MAPLLERAGARILVAAPARRRCSGRSKWTRWRWSSTPTRRAFLDMVTSPEYLEIAHLRTEALERSELHPLDPADALA